MRCIELPKHLFCTSKMGRELISKLKLNDREQVLDIGCDSGKITVEIVANCNQVQQLGIDNSEKMLKLAQRRPSVGY